MSRQVNVTMSKRNQKLDKAMMRFEIETKKPKCSLKYAITAGVDQGNKSFTITHYDMSLLENEIKSET